MQSLIILGRQPTIGLAELESLFGADCIQPFGQQAALLDLPLSAINFKRLGGALKLAKILGITNISNLREDITKNLRSLNLPVSGKINFGISAYNMQIPTNSLLALALESKKFLRKSSGLNIRVIPNRSQNLNTAQVSHNKLATESGIELLLVADKDKIIIARTADVQDIASYTIRDRGRPKRDARVGMLPPKLAQIIINLATSTLPITDTCVLDPFCGTGVILQEALLTGFDAYGTDVEPRMVDYSIHNIDWLKRNYPTVKGQVKIETGNATSYVWHQPIKVVASETYLGKPLTYQPSKDQLQDMIAEINSLDKEFLKNLGTQLKSGDRLCLAIPAWFINNHFVSLPFIDQLTDLGYNLVALKHVKAQDLIYHRPEQFVARQLIILTRN